MSKKPVDSLHALLADTVDYAGLFPPSKVSMETAVRNYADYLKSEHNWMIGRFVVPVADLDRFIEAQKSIKSVKEAWRLSVIGGAETLTDFEKINHFNENNSHLAQIDAVEIKAESAEKIRETARFLPENIDCYFEIPSSIILTELLTAIAVSKTRAKIRTGGITLEAFPPVDEIVKFMRVCAAANVPFKATAGLHHPLRCHKPLTYETNAPKGTMNGFLNLFLTVAFLRKNLNSTFVHELMKETDANNFTFTDDGATWKDHAVTTQEIEIARQRCVISFGSCSFTEPIEDLKTLNILH